MTKFKKLLSLLSVFALVALVGFSLSSEANAQAVTSIEHTNIIEQCVPEGEMARTTVSPQYRTECCDYLETMHPYDYSANNINYEGGITRRMVGTGSLCYNSDKGTPECLEDSGIVEGWYYPNGDLLKEFQCKVRSTKMTKDEEIDEEIEIENEDNKKRTKILNLQQMRYHKDIIRKEDGSLYGVKKDQEIIDRIKGNERVEEEREKQKVEEKVRERKEEIEKIRKNVGNLINKTTENLEQKIEELKSKLEKKVEIIEQQREKMDYVAEVLRGQESLSDNIKVALSEFISKGTDDNSEKIGEGERVAVLKSYKYAYGHLPQNEEQIEDAIKISNGRFPSQTSEEAETKAKLEFEKIYNREVNMESPNDSAAVNIMAYGLKQKAQNRNLQSERRGISIFEDIYGYLPQNTQEWNAMQAITYSGAKK